MSRRKGRGGIGKKSSKKSSERRSVKDSAKKIASAFSFRGSRFGKPSEKRNGLRKETRNAIEQALVRYFYKNRDKVVNHKQVLEAMNAKQKEEISELDQNIIYLYKRGYIVVPETGKYQFNNDIRLYKGKLVRKTGFKIVFVPEGAENANGADEVFIGEDNMNHALANDTVLIRKFDHTKEDSEAGS